MGFILSMWHNFANYCHNRGNISTCNGGTNSLNSHAFCDKLLIAIFIAIMLACNFRLPSKNST